MNVRDIIKTGCSSIAAVLLLTLLVSPLYAQDKNPEATEVYLTFQYRGVISNYVTSYYKDQQFYLPINELFNLLKIQHEVQQGDLVISGNYLGEEEYRFDFNNRIARHGDKTIPLSANDFIISELDYFVKPEIFSQLFGLKFSTDFNTLTLDLSTEDKMPVVAQYERVQRRKRADLNQPVFEQEYYPLKFGREQEMLDGAFLDYNVTGVYTENYRLLNFSNAIGMEIAGGDLRGNIFGSLSNERQSITTNNLRWRYVNRDSRYFSSGIAGQTTTEGITNRTITGFKVTNKPIQPRRLFGRYLIEGSAPEKSEVELYLNNQLIDYQEADQTGTYRFMIPLTYGSTNYSVRIYKPNGQSIVKNERVEVPFNYLPPGVTDYSISAGQLDEPILGSTQRGYIGSATINTGITDWLTASASTEYLSEYHRNLPSFTGTLNARLFSNYLLSANFNSENFYRLTSSMIMSNGMSWNASYDYNPGNSQLYNVGGNTHQALVSFFTPINFNNFSLNLHLSSSYQQRRSISRVRYRADLSSRIGRLYARLGYQDSQTGAFSLAATPASRITNSYTYTLKRTYNMPEILRGMFLRGQFTYLPESSRFEEMEMQLSTNILQTGRLQFTLGHNFLGNFNTAGLNLTIDFNKTRSSSSIRAGSNSYSITQSLRGSIGYDPYFDQMLLDNRQQVGQAGVAVRLYMDKNNDGTFQDSTDEIIHDPAVRINRAGGKVSVKNGVNYVTQLLSYYQYNLEINKGALSNPLLVPDVENFSIVTDPNQFKTIEIPFYQSGVVSGKVQRKVGNNMQGAGGVRLILESNYEDSTRDEYSEELRTFSDGGFYTYEVPPGDYHLYVDPNQLEFLQAISKPDTMNITVKSLAQGDFIENLNFQIIPKSDTTETEELPVITEKTDSTETITDQQLYYRIQLASFKTLEKAKEVARNATIRLGDTFSVIKNTANGLYAIRSTPVPQYNDVVKTIISYRKSKFRDAAIVVLKDQDIEQLVKSSPVIQIGAFSTAERAQRFADAASRGLVKDIAISNYQSNSLYKVYIYDTTSRDNLIDYKARLQNNFTFKGAYINQNGNIQLGAFHSVEQAKIFGNLVGLKLESNISVTNQMENGLFDVFIDRNFEFDNEKRDYLERIREMGSVFNDAFITNLPLSSYDVSKNQRNMAFNFEIHVKSRGDNIDMSEFPLESMNINSVNTYKNDLGEFVFENIPTWSKTKEIYEKLQNNQELDYPILILIEERND